MTGMTRMGRGDDEGAATTYRPVSVLAVYASSLGASTATVGLLVAAFSAARLLVNVPAGQSWVVDMRLGLLSKAETQSLVETLGSR